MTHRRVVTGLDKNGKSCVLFDDAGGMPGHGGKSRLLWKSGKAPASNDGTAEAADEPDGVYPLIPACVSSIDGVSCAPMWQWMQSQLAPPVLSLPLPLSLSPQALIVAANAAITSVI